MRGAALQPPPRDEQQIIRDATKSGMFMSSGPSMREAYMRHFERMQANAEVRAMQEQRRAMQEAQRTQQDYEQVLCEQAQSTIAPLRAFRHQMNDRRRMAEQI